MKKTNQQENVFVNSKAAYANHKDAKKAADKKAKASKAKQTKTNTGKAVKNVKNAKNAKPGKIRSFFNKIPKKVWIPVVSVASTLVVASVAVGIPYFMSANVALNDARELKASLKMSIYYLKEGDVDAADACITQAEHCIASLRTDLADTKWQVATYIPFAGSGIKEDLDTASQALDIAEEATQTILRPASNYVRELGQPDLEQLDITNMGPEMAVRINGYCDMIDDLSPAASKVLHELGDLPEFHTGMLEDQISQYRLIGQNADVLIPLLNSASSDILRPAAAVMTETPFSDLRMHPGINTAVITAYWDLLDEITPELVEINDTLVMLAQEAEDPAIYNKYSEKMITIIDLIHEADTYRPLYDNIVSDGEDKFFIIVAQNSAEMRACGGFPGSIGNLSLKDGILYFGDFTSIYNVIPDTHASWIDITDTENKLFLSDWYGNNPRRASCNPHFPRAAELWGSAYQEFNGVEVDGVVSLTPHIIQRLMAVTGPVTLSNGVTIDETNAVDYLQRQIYIDYFTTYGMDEANVMTDYIFAETAKIVGGQVMDHLNKDSLITLLDIIKESSADRVFMMWMKDPEAEQIIYDLGFSGSLNDDPENPALGVFFSVNDANKLGPYLDIDISYDDGVYNEDGSISYHVTVAVTNNIDEETLEIGEGNAYILAMDYGGSMNSLIYLFAPAGGSVSDFENDGEVSITIEKYNDLELGFSPRFILHPGETITFTYTATTAPGITTPPTIMTQPLITDYRPVEEEEITEETAEEA